VISRARARPSQTSSAVKSGTWSPANRALVGSLARRRRRTGSACSTPS
jgi:hypothetical protein